MESTAVRDFFNRKADGWFRKYDDTGPLAHRLHLFGETLVAHLPPPASVLELGCGTGNLAAHLASRGYRVLGCDIAEEMLTRARVAFPHAGIDWRLVESNDRLPTPDASCDAVVASSVFEYVDDPERTFDECRRVLRPGGVLLLTVPTTDHWHRRLESGIVPFASLVRELPSLWPARVQGYADYLVLSRNRLPLEHWLQVARHAGFVTVQAPDRRAGSLTLLALRRAT